MAISENLENKLRMVYEPSSMVSLQYKGNDLVFKTDKEGNPILLFVGRIDSEGFIRGERYARVLKRDDKGIIIRDHWDLKGKSS